MQSKLISLSGLILALSPTAFAEMKEIPVDAFSKIAVDGGIAVNYASGPAHTVRVEEENGDYSDIDISVSNGKLKVKRRSLSGSGWGDNASMSTKWKNGKIAVKVNGKIVPSYTVTVTSPKLEFVKSVQSSKLTATGLNADKFEASASSSGDIELDGRAISAKLKASSSGALDADQLSVTSVEIEASSSGEVYATASDGDVIGITASSSSDVRIEATGSPDITIDASSSADVVLEGTCNFLEASISSSADVTGKRMSCKTADVSASSSGDLSLTVTESVIARASSGGDINISGLPTQRDVSRSSGGDVDFTG